MAKIIVSGDTSGSVTIEAPAIAGSPTLTLPTTSGTLVVTGGAQTIEFADGTVSAPSITNSGDTNTGIYFPAADTIAFTEGGVESMRIDSSGNVGIGVAPSAWSAYKGLNIGLNTTLAGSTGGSVGLLSTNAYFDGSSYKYISTDAATQYQQNTGEHIWRTAASGSAGATLTFTERMRIDSSGNVGIGTSSPANKLHVKGVWTNNEGQFQIDADSGQQFSGLTIQNNGTVKSFLFHDNTGSYSEFQSADEIRLNVTGANALKLYTSSTERMRITSDGQLLLGSTTSTALANPQVQVGSTSATVAGLQILSSTTGTGGVYYGDSTTGNARFAGYIEYLHTSNNMVFGVGEVERMRITSGGRLAIGSTTTNFPLYVKLSGDSGDWFAKFENTVGSTPYGFWINYSALSPNNTGSEFILCNDSTAQRMTVRSNGGIANYQANDANLSDEREKTNIQLAGSYLDKICAIPVKTFNYIDQNREEDDGLTLGVIAQDVQKVAPELVMESNWAAKNEPEKMRLSIYQTDLQYALMKCIQEQQAMIEELKARIETLEAK